MFGLLLNSNELDTTESLNTTIDYSVSVAHKINDIEDVISLTGFAVYSTKVLPISYIEYETDSQNSLSCYYEGDNLYIKIHGEDLSQYAAFLIIEYTKTTDKALSQAEIDALDDGRGEPGLSAYDIAVQYGEFTGSEREWLASLTKPALPKGGTTGQLLVKQSNLDGVAGWQGIKLENRTFLYEQITASTEWVITHNLNTTEFTYRVIADSGDEIICDLEIVNSNVVKVLLTDPMSGQFQMIARTSESVPVPTRYVEVDQYSEKIFNIGVIHGDVNVLLSNGPIQYIEPDGDINIQIFDWPEAGRSGSVTFVVKYNETVYNMVFANKILWSYDNAPEADVNSYIRFSIISDDNGKTQFGIFLGVFKF